MSGTKQNSIEDRIAAALKQTKYPPVPERFQDEDPPEGGTTLGKLCPPCCHLLTLLIELQEVTHTLSKQLKSSGDDVELQKAIQELRLAHERFGNEVTDQFGEVVNRQTALKVYCDWQVEIHSPKLIQIIILGFDGQEQRIVEELKARLDQKLDS